MTDSELILWMESELGDEDIEFWTRLLGRDDCEYWVRIGDRKARGKTLEEAIKNIRRL